MNWTRPDSEEAWGECLSAYVDGETSPEELAAIEAHLQTNPVRAGQVRELRSLSAALHEWDVDVPAESSPRTLDFAVGARRPDRAIRRIRAWQLAAAVFIVGVSVGTAGTLFVQRATAPEIVSVQHEDSAGRILAQAPPAITPDQAETLLRELDAENVKTTLRKQIRERNWTGAASTYRELTTAYADTAAATTLDKDTTVQRFTKAAGIEWRSHP